MNKKTVAILIHGFNVWDGGVKTVGKLESYFMAAGVNYYTINYGHFGFLSTRYKNDDVAKKVKRACTAAVAGGYEVIVVGHSNGCAIIHRAMEEYKAEIDKVVFVNPALKKDIELTEIPLVYHVWYSPSDKPVKMAKWLPKVDARPWGEMGATGYTGNLNRVVNYNKENNFQISSKSHSDMFEPEKLLFFGPMLVERILSV